MTGLKTFSWDLHLFHLLRRLSKHRLLRWLQCLSSLDNCTVWDRLRSEKYREGPEFHWGLEAQVGRSHLASLEYHCILEVPRDLLFYLCSLSIRESNNLAVLSPKSGRSLKPLCTCWPVVVISHTCIHLFRRKGHCPIVGRGFSKTCLIYIFLSFLHTVWLSCIISSLFLSIALQTVVSSF